MFTNVILLASLFDIAHFLWIATSECLGYKAIIQIALSWGIVMFTVKRLLCDRACRALENEIA